MMADLWSGVKRLKRGLESVDERYFDSYGDTSVHSLMLRDKPRNEAYAEAFSKDDLRGKIVMDVGCGTGILSMLAAKNNAKHVHAVEANKKIAEVAIRLIKANGLSDLITVHICPVEKLKLDVQVDIIVSEWMGHYLFHESMLDSVLFARDAFLAKGGKLFPENCTLYVCPLDLEDLRRETEYFHDVCGLDFSSEFSADKKDLGVDLEDSQPNTTRGIKEENVFCDELELVSFDLNTVKPDELIKFSRSFEFRTTKSGSFGGIGFWWEVRFPVPSIDYTAVRLNTGPYKPSTHWKQTILFMNGFHRIPKNEKLDFTITMTQSEENRREYLMELIT